MLNPVRSFVVEKLAVEIHENRQALGKAAGTRAAEKMRELLKERDSINVVFAAAPSQNEFLETLMSEPGIDWERVRAFHLDEYLSLPSDAPQRFAVYLDERVFSKVKFKEIHYLRGDTDSPEGEAQRYADLLTKYPIDIAFLGIGENGHLAFIDPPVADFEDPYLVKIVELDKVCRQQQVNDGAFSSIDLVPKTALSMTIPAIMAAKNIYCMVPGPTKAKAVKETLYGPISTHCPATILRRHDAAVLFIDRDAAGLIEDK